VVAVVVDERIGGDDRCLIAGGRFEGGGEVKLWESSITNRSLVNRKTKRKGKIERERERERKR